MLLQESELSGALLKINEEIARLEKEQEEKEG